MKQTLLIVTALMLVVGFSNAQTYQFAETYYDNGMPKVIKTFKESKGKLELVNENKWHENGQKKEEGTYKDGEPNGKWTDWYENGQKRWEGTYKNGEPAGKWIRWHENGKKYKERTFKNGEPAGKWFRWHENGQKQVEETYKDGEPAGKWIRWYENGQKHWEGTYKNGEQDGVWAYWYENGQKSEERTYKGGKRIDATIIGEWELVPDVMEKALKDEGLEGEGLEMALKMLSSMSMTFEFKEDGTLLVSASAFGGSESESGEWKLDGSTLKTRQGQEDWEQIEISLSGDELVMKKGEESLGFKRVK